MVKRIFLALILFVALPALAAVETTTINFTVVLPSGATATGGTVMATLSTSGETPNGASTSVVAARTSATIASNGAVALVLVPNDAITPEGTYYIFHYDVRTPTPASWKESRTVATTPDPALISETTLLDAAPGIAAPLSRIQDEATSLTRRSKLNFTGGGVSCTDSPANSRTNCHVGGASGTYYATDYATSGTGAAGDCWVTSGSNPVAAALAACPSTGCDVILSAGCYTLGSDDPAVTIPKTTAASDQRVYRIIGQGKDKSILNYSGTGTAIRYWQDHTGTPGSSIQSNANMLKGFALRQTGTVRTGTGIWINYGSKWSIEDLSVGSLLTDRNYGDLHGFDYGIKFAERSSGYLTVDDFMSITDCYFSKNNHAVYTGLAGDSMRVMRNHFDGGHISATTVGFEMVGATDGLFMAGNNFNFFNYDSSSTAIKLSGRINSAAIIGNHIEQNGVGIKLSSDARENGVVISGNTIILKNISGAYGIDAGSGGGYAIRGLVISGNSIQGIYANTVGINLRADVKDAVIGPNGYESDGAQSLLAIATGTTGAGANVIVNEYVTPNTSMTGNINAGQTGLASARVLHNAAGGVGFRAQNTSSTNGNSPTIDWIAGGASNLSMSSYVDSSGTLHFNNGSDQLTVSAIGAATATSLRASGGSTSTAGQAVWSKDGTSCATACTALLGSGGSCSDSVPLDGTNTPLGNCSSTTGLRLCECY